ncbi:MAG TPA: chromosome partitioning protein ParA, partial [Burkholderiales bacterium]|nr:chromosome partitioning protein ParA [Burkholderiales bacterium]
MARILALVLIFLLPSLGTLARADPPGRVARLNYAAGAVSFAPAQAPDAWTQAVHNRPISDGDRLWAGETGRAELHIGSLALRLAPLTSVDVLHLDDDVVQLRLAQGALNVRVRELDAGEIIEIATPTGAVLLRQPGSY